MKGLHGLVLAAVLFHPAAAVAQSIGGTVTDQTGAPLPGVSVELSRAGQPGGSQPGASTATGGDGRYQFRAVAPGDYVETFTLINFASVRREVTVVNAAVRLDAVMRLALNADVTVTGKRTFTNLADAEHPAEDLLGIAQSASQGAITSRQLEARPVMRTAEVLETVPGVIVAQHSGEGKANQYYLRGFNLDHGTDFATTVAGMPVNMPTHGHSHGYSDLNFMIPELVSGIQFSKGPYFADQGDFATAGASNINYVSSLDRPIARATGGGEGFGRVLAAASPGLLGGRMLAAVELAHDDGPWATPDEFRKLNAVVRYSRGDAVNGASVTAMAYRATWRATDQIPRRAVDNGALDRFGTLDASDGGETYRYSLSTDWQQSRANAVTRFSAYGIAYDLGLFSNFTYALDDPERGDQVEQRDHRYIGGGRVTYRRMDRWWRADVQNSFGVQLRADDITAVALYHTQQRRRLGVVRDDAVAQENVGVFVQNEAAWRPWLRTMAGLRMDGYHFSVTPRAERDPGTPGTHNAGIVSPKGGVVVGPWRGTELYGNAGFGFHSNDARVRATPLVRARGLEAGVRSVVVRHLQTTISLWRLDLDSELVFVGDAGTTEAGRPSRRRGIELANYYTPRPWLIFDFDLSWSRARFADTDPSGTLVPGAVASVVSAGATIDGLRNIYGSVRTRYFGPRPLVEDDSVRSNATALTNVEAGYKLSRRMRLGVDVFNVFDARDSDIDYYYTSRLPGEPSEGVADVHFHPALPRTARLTLQIAF